MKAKDYYEKYKSYFFIEKIEISASGRPIRAWNAIPITELTVRTIIDDFIWEARSMAESRRAEGLDSCDAVMREQDLKWQAMCRMFTKHHGYSPLRTNDFWYWAEQFTKK